MINLTFKSTDAAFEYAQEYFGQTKLSAHSSFIGVVRLIDVEKEPITYLIEIACKAGANKNACFLGPLYNRYELPPENIKAF